MSYSRISGQPVVEAQHLTTKKHPIKTQQRIEQTYRFVCSYFYQHGMVPMQKKIKKELNHSINTTTKYMKALVEQGKLVKKSKDRYSFPSVIDAIIIPTDSPEFPKLAIQDEKPLISYANIYLKRKKNGNMPIMLNYIEIHELQSKPDSGRQLKFRPK
jgi:hypothetical protein